MADENTPADNPPAEKPKCDQAFFLALAAKGKDAWNAWRRDPANKDVRVTFSGIDFRKGSNDTINFAGFEFGDRADFSRCKWRGVTSRKFLNDPEVFTPRRASFAGARFGERAFFDRTVFGGGATFTGAAFGNDADFSDAVFGERASFLGAAFGDGAVFDGTDFGNGVSFSGAAFGDLAHFNGAAFGNRALRRSATTWFQGAAFGYGARFAGATFGGVGDFRGAAFGERASFEDTVFKGRVDFTGTAKELLSKELEATADKKDKVDRIVLKKRLEDSWQLWRTGPDRFLAISFARARFNRRVDFTGRTFENDTDFKYARFCRPPEFQRGTNLAQIDFTGAYIGIGHPACFRLTCDTDVLVRLGALRKNAGKERDDDRERDLYIEERKAELGIHVVRWFEDLKKASMFEWLFVLLALIGHLLWIAVMFLCWAVADYGRSFVRPAVWLVLSEQFFHWGYTYLLPPMPADSPKAANFDAAVWMVALGNAVPFGGSFASDDKVKKLLFCAYDAGPDCLLIPPEEFQLLVSFQNIVSIILVFFIVLALRNYFRIK